MSNLYRTTSDRGLWKKYHRDNIQHFHKAQYLDKDRDKPQVTYSRLNLGENIRSYNNRQSNPNVSRDLEEINQRFNRTHSAGHIPRKFSTKSAPGSRAATPNRVRNKDRYLYESYLLDPKAGFSSIPRPTTADSQFSQETYPDDDRMSYESRSLAAYSNFSGRDSVLDSGLNSNGYRYPYASEPLNGTYVTDLDQDKPNPFVRGTEIQREADSGVQAYLRQVNNQVNNRYADSVSSSVISSDPPRPHPGRIEDLPSPTGPVTLSSSGGAETDEVFASPTRSLSSREKIRQLKKDFLDRQADQQLALQKPKANKYLKEENRWTPPVKKTPNETGNMNGPTVLASGVVSSFNAPQMHHAQLVTLRPDNSSSDSSDTEGIASPPNHMVLQSPMVPMPPLPQASRQSRPKDPPPPLPKRGASPNVGVEKLLNNLEGRPQNGDVRLPQVPMNTWEKPSNGGGFVPSGSMGRPRRKSSEDRSFSDPAEASFQNKFQETSKKKSGFFSSIFKKRESKKDKLNKKESTNNHYRSTNNDSGTSSGESSFEDDGETGHVAPFQKKGQHGTVQIPIQRGPMEPSHGEVEHLGATPIAPIPPVQRQISSTSQESGPLSSSSPLPPPLEVLGHMGERQLERKLSMSKPTNLDDLLRQQEEEENIDQEKHKPVSHWIGNSLTRQELSSRGSRTTHEFNHFEASSIQFSSDALAKMMPAPNDRVYGNTIRNNDPTSNSFASHETTQEIDVDEALGISSEENTDSSSKKEVDNPMEWPKKTSVLREPVEMHPNFHRPSDSPTKESKVKKPGFFSFGRKWKEEKNDDQEVHIDPIVDVVELSRQAELPATSPENPPPAVPRRNVESQPDANRRARRDSSSSSNSVGSQTPSRNTSRSKSPPRSRSNSRKPGGSTSGLGGFFRSPFGEKKQRSSIRPKSFGGLGAVDVSHYLEDDDIPMPKQLERKPSTTTDDELDPRYQHIKHAPDPDERDSRDEKAYDQNGSIRSSRSSLRSIPQEKKKKKGFFNFGSWSKPKNKQSNSMKRTKSRPKTTDVFPDGERSSRGSRTSLDRTDEQSLSSLPDEQGPYQPESFKPDNGRRSGFFNSKPRNPRGGTMPSPRRGPISEFGGGGGPPRGRPQGGPPRGRSSSMPRSKSSGFSGMFGGKPSQRRGPPPRSRRDSFEGSMELDPQSMPSLQMQHHGSQSLPRRPRRQSGGFGSMFNVQPKRRPPPQRRASGPNFDPEMDDENDGARNQMQSLPRRRPPPRSGGGFGSLFGGTSARRSGRRAPMRSHPQAPMGRNPRNDYPEDERVQNQSNWERDPEPMPSREPMERRGSRSSLSDASPKVAHNQSASMDRRMDPIIPKTNSSPGPPQRQMGRRSGRFRKNPPTFNSANSSYGGSRSTHDLSLPPSGARTHNSQSLVADLFAETAARPSSRSVSNLKPAGEDAVDSKLEDQQVDRLRTITKSAASLARTESYRQAKNAPLSKEGTPAEGFGGLPARQARSHSSMPRLSNKNRPILTEFKATNRNNDDADSRSLGGRSTGSRRGGPDPCVVM